MLTNMTLL